MSVPSRSEALLSVIAFGHGLLDRDRFIYRVSRLLTGLDDNRLLFQPTANGPKRRVTREMVRPYEYKKKIKKIKKVNKLKSKQHKEEMVRRLLVRQLCGEP